MNVETVHVNSLSASWEIKWTDNLSWIIIHRIYSFSEGWRLLAFWFLSGEINDTSEQDLVKFLDTSINIYINLISTLIQNLNGKKKLQHNVSTATATLFYLPISSKFIDVLSNFRACCSVALCNLPTPDRQCGSEVVGGCLQCWYITWKTLQTQHKWVTYSSIFLSYA